MGSCSGIASLALVIMLTGCAGTQKSAENKPKPVHPVARQASFDLNCPRPELRYLQIAPDQWGAVGCGKRARYKRVCQQRHRGNGPWGPRFEDHCSWVLNSPVLANDADGAQRAAEPRPGQSL